MTDLSDRTVLYCPHCGNTSVQTHLLAQDYEMKLYETPSAKEFGVRATYHVARCETCSEILVYSYCHIFDASVDTPFGELVYPKQTAFTNAVPEKVRKAYFEAVKVKNISPSAFVVLSRRVLEEVVRDRGVAAGNLAASLDQLSTRGELPPVLAKASTLVRLIGNAGAHAGELEVNQLHVWPVDEFLKAVIEYTYVAPARIAEFQKSLQSTEKPVDSSASGVGTE